MRLPQNILKIFLSGLTEDTSTLDNIPETRNIHESKKEKDKSNITSLPANLKYLYSDEKFYTVRFEDYDKELRAILTAIDPTIVLFPEKEITEKLDLLKSNLARYLSSIYKEYEYRQYGYKQQEMLENLNAGTITKPLLHLAADVLQKNICLIKSDNSIEIISDYIHSSNIVLWNNNDTIGVVLHPSNDILLPINRKFTKLSQIKIKKNLLKLSKNDLNKQATLLGFTTDKKKDELIDEIVHYKLNELN
ncbi:MAG: hypothetical protein CBB84_000110 [Phycisphaera sp. TMED24]|nr:MAG: hypothetical protein CBB84_000110 [Phycisphaera sp. TMED24]|tara:strand:+ start:864 stop:1610 length:747 start_codon:yes stop_codon:yes gene_type:complete